MDAANLAWKLGLYVRNKAKIESILPSYDRERRLHAAGIVHVSGSYLRFACNSKEPVPALHHLGVDLGKEAIERSIRARSSGVGPPGMNIPPHLFLIDFFMRYRAFLLGLDVRMDLRSSTCHARTAILAELSRWRTEFELPILAWHSARGRPGTCMIR